MGMVYWSERIERCRIALNMTKSDLCEIGVRNYVARLEREHCNGEMFPPFKKWYTFKDLALIHSKVELRELAEVYHGFSDSDTVFDGTVGADRPWYEKRIYYKKFKTMNRRWFLRQRKTYRYLCSNIRSTIVDERHITHRRHIDEFMGSDYAREIMELRHQQTLSVSQ